MNKFIIMIVMLFSVNLVTSSPINADSPLIEVEIRSGIDPQRRLVDHGIHRSYTWTFENADYTVIYAIDEQDYSRIRNDHRKRRYNHDHFAPMVYRGVESLEKLIREFNQKIPQSWTQERKVNFVLAFVTATISYEYDKTTGYNEYYKHPIETITEGIGDCEDTSILFASILSGLDFESALLAIPPVLDRQVGHIAVGVKGNFLGWHVNYKENKYFFCETAADRKVFKVGMLSEEYENVPVEAIPITRHPVPPQKVRPRTVQPTPKPPVTPSPQISLKNGIDLFYRARYNEAIKSLQLALSGLNNPRERAEAYIYLGKTEYTFPGDSFSNSIKRAEDRFEQALRENPEQEIEGQKFKDLFEKVRENSIGELTVSASLPQTEIWIYGNGIKRKKLGTGPNPIKVKLFKGGYTVEGIYAGKSKQEVVKIEPEAHTKVHIEIPLVDDSPPIIQLVDPPQTANVNQEIAIRAKITDDSVVKVNFYYGFSRYSRSEPARYSEGTIIHIKTSDIYTGIISSQNKVGYIWYYLTATDREGNKAETQKRVLEISPKYTPPENQPPSIELIDTIQTTKVNQRIRVKAKVTGDTSIKSIHLHYGFSRYSRSEPARYSEGAIIHIKASDIYTGIISSENKVGYIWYYLTATDREGNKAETQKRVLEIKISLKYTPPENQPPSIELIDTIQTTKVNQQIRVKAKVTGDTSIKSIHLHYGFSQFPGSEPIRYEEKKYSYMGTTTNTEYIGSIPRQTKNGYVWYYLTATDEEGKGATSEKRVIAIQSPPETTPGPPIYDPPSEPDPPDVNAPDIPKHQGIWANYAWPSEVFEDGGPIFDSNRGDAINFTYLREGRTYQTLGVQLDYSYQNPSNMSATFQWGPALGKSPITFTLLTGIAGYRKPDFTRTTSTLTTDVSDKSIYITPILGVGLKYYPLDRVAIDATGSLKLPSTFDATSLYHYEVGSRIYITDALNLKIGYSQWYLGSQNIARIQVGLGITF